MSLDAVIEHLHENDEQMVCSRQVFCHLMHNALGRVSNRKTGSVPEIAFPAMREKCRAFAFYGGRVSLQWRWTIGIDHVTVVMRWKSTMMAICARHLCARTTPPSLVAVDPLYGGGVVGLLFAWSCKGRRVRAVLHRPAVSESTSPAQERRKAFTALPHRTAPL